MLKILRKKGVMKKLLWMVAIVIIISFGFFGTANYLSNRDKASYAGKIFGRRVSFEEFRNSLLHARTQAIIRYGENFFKISQFLDLSKEAWDRLILLHEAQKRKIKISDQEVISAIQEIPFFKTTDRFDPVLYQRIVQYVFRCTPRQFEEGMRDSLIFAKLFEQETFLIDIPDEEIRKAYQEANEEVQIDYILYANKDFANAATVSPDEMQSYYEENKESFRLPASINIEYLHLEYPLEITEEQRTATADTMGEIMRDLSSGVLFEEAAKKYGLPLQESGFFSKEQPNLTLGWSYELLQKVFELKEGQLSPPIETSKGYYVLRVKQKRDAYLPEFTEAKPKVLETLKTLKAKQLAQSEAQKGLERFKQTVGANPQKDIAAIAKELNLPIQETVSFKRGEYIAGIGVSKEFQETAFALNENNKTSDPIEITTGFCFLNLRDFIPVDEQKFTEERDEFASMLLQKKKNEAFTDFLSRLRASANLQSNLERPSDFPVGN